MELILYLLLNPFILEFTVYTQHRVTNRQSSFFSDDCGTNWKNCFDDTITWCSSRRTQHCWCCQLDHGSDCREYDGICRGQRRCPLNCFQDADNRGAGDGVLELLSPHLRSMYYELLKEKRAVKMMRLLLCSYKLLSYIWK